MQAHKPCRYINERCREGQGRKQSRKDSQGRKRTSNSDQYYSQSIGKQWPFQETSRGWDGGTLRWHMGGGWTGGLKYTIYKGSSGPLKWHMPGDERGDCQGERKTSVKMKTVSGVPFPESVFPLLVVFLNKGSIQNFTQKVLGFGNAK